jgi:hypothetical protein
MHLSAATSDGTRSPPCFRSCVAAGLAAVADQVPALGDQLPAGTALGAAGVFAAIGYDLRVLLRWLQGRPTYPAAPFSTRQRNNPPQNVGAKLVTMSTNAATAAGCA